MKLPGVKIGDTVVENGLFLAPMAGFTDAPFRKICRECGAGYTVSEMISAKAVCFGDRKTGELSRLPANSGPTSIQLFGHEPDVIGEAVRRLLGGVYRSDGDDLPAAIDINMGCPMKKIVSSGDGSALMKDPSLCRDTVAAARAAAGDIPVTVKIRAGFDEEHKNAAAVAAAAVSAGAAAVFVHGRTREQFYAPSSSNEVISAVRDALPPYIPVIGNGDVDSIESADRMIRETGCDGIMIGRAALGDPWLFGRIAAAMNGTILPEPCVDERIECALRLCREVCAKMGETRGIPACRGRIGNFIKGIRGASAVRHELCQTKTLEEIYAVLNKIRRDHS